MKCPACDTEFLTVIAIAPIVDSNEKFLHNIHICDNQDCEKYHHGFTKILGKDEPAELYPYEIKALGGRKP